MNVNKAKVRNNCVFINRVNIQGNEVETFIQLKIILTKELQEEVKPPKEK